jgi:hypothetical protein
MKTVKNAFRECDVHVYLHQTGVRTGSCSCSLSCCGAAEFAVVWVATRPPVLASTGKFI